MTAGRLPDCLLAVLRALTEVDAAMTAAGLAQVTGYSQSNISPTIMHGFAYGCIDWDKRGKAPGLARITEKGKIALALEIGKRARNEVWSWSDISSDESPSGAILIDTPSSTVKKARRTISPEKLARRLNAAGKLKSFAKR